MANLNINMQSNVPPQNANYNQMQEQTMTPNMNTAFPINISNDLSPKKLTPIAICRLGQDYIQEIVQKVIELMSFIRSIQLPLGNTPLNIQQYVDRKTKLEDALSKIETCFQKLRFCFISTNKLTSNIPYKPISCYLPIGNDIDFQDFSDQSEKNYSPDELELINQIKDRNFQLKEIMNEMQTIIWEVDSMVATSRSSPKKILLDEALNSRLN